jgi:hypothetical protein
LHLPARRVRTAGERQPRAHAGRARGAKAGGPRPRSCLPTGLCGVAGAGAGPAGSSGRIRRRVDVPSRSPSDAAVSAPLRAYRGRRRATAALGDAGGEPATAGTGRPQRTNEEACTESRAPFRSDSSAGGRVQAGNGTKCCWLLTPNTWVPEEELVDLHHGLWFQMLGEASRPEMQRLSSIDRSITASYGKPSRVTAT